MQSSEILAQWSHRMSCHSTSVILPDGCRDIIIEQDNRDKLSYFISPLAEATYTVYIQPAKTLTGFRLQPGITIDETGISAFFNSYPQEVLMQGDWISEFCYLKTSMQETLQALASDLSSITLVARQLGVSARTLQRHVKTETGKSPHFWRSLVRARRCARLLQQQTSFIEAAIACGYSDQAHMNRELRRWFNARPCDLKAGLHTAAIAAVGYD